MNLIFSGGQRLAAKEGQKGKAIVAVRSYPTMCCLFVCEIFIVLQGKHDGSCCCPPRQHSARALQARLDLLNQPLAVVCDRTWRATHLDVPRSWFVRCFRYPCLRSLRSLRSLHSIDLRAGGDHLINRTVTQLFSFTIILVLVSFRSWTLRRRGTTTCSG